MVNLKYAVGLDLGKDTFKACLSVINTQQQVSVKASKSFANTPAGFSALSSWVAKHRKEDLPVVFVMEATGVYHEKLAWYLHQQQCQVSILLPTKAKRYIQSLGYKSKNDKIDAQALAMMACQQALPFWKPFSPNLYQLRQLTRFYQSLQEQKTVLNNQLHAFSHGMHQIKLIEKQLSKTISLLQKQIQEIEKQIRSLIEKDAKLQEQYEHISEIKGVGLLTFAVLVAETGGFYLIENQKQLVSYAGYDVVENQSGNHTGKTKIYKKGNPRIRRAMHLPAFQSVIHKEPGLAELFERVYNRCGIKMKAYVAVQKKLLCLIYSLWKNNTSFDRQHHLRVKPQDVALTA